MKLKISEGADPNYLASVVEIKQLRNHENADRLKIATVFGNDCIVSSDTNVGDVFVFFPLECQISSKLLSHCNLFSDASLNADGKTKSYFCSKRRVKALKLRGERSSGFLMRTETFADWCGYDASQFVQEIGVDFDTIDDELVCEKYIPVIQRSQGGANEPKSKVAKKDSIVQRLLPNQFRLHGSTAHLGKNVHILAPDDIISITSKLHGQNFVASNVLTRPILSFKDKVASFFGVRVVDKQYQFIYSSRNIIKSRRDGSIGSDQWGIHAETLKNKLPPGITVVGELVGFTPSGNGIQKHYDYSCEPFTSKLKIFRITYTDPIGELIEFSWLDIVRLCEKYNLETVPCEYIGRAGDLFPDLCDDLDDWGDQFLKKLDEKYLNKKCSLCKNDVPNEGIVLAIENKVNRPVFKYKSFLFLEKEGKARDNGELENEES